MVMQALSFQEQNFPSFLRTAHLNKEAIESIVSFVLYFILHWAALLYADDEDGNDGLTLFKEMNEDTDTGLIKNDC